MLVAIGFGMGWVFIVLGLLIRTPTTVMTLGFTFLFPLVFASNIMVDPGTMPDWLRAFVDVNPVSLMTTALRGLMGGGATLRPDRAGADRAGGADRDPGADDAVAISPTRVRKGSVAANAAPAPAARGKRVPVRWASSPRSAALRERAISLRKRLALATLRSAGADQEEY